MSVAEKGTVPLSQPLGPGTVGHLAGDRDTSRDSGGTVDLKALARKVLDRDTSRDTSRDSMKNTVPAPSTAWDTCPAEWREGLAALDPNHPPAGIAAPLWRATIRDAELFLATWGRQAANLGWTTLDLFGAHSLAPGARYSCMGLLLLIRGGRVVALTTASAAIEQQSGARLTYTRQLVEAECVPLWRLAGVASTPA
jgi:hypothetical protein